MTDRYAVVGNPIKHSKSPQIHSQFAEQTQQDLNYRSKLVELGRFASDIRAFFADGGCGLNVTVPFKQEAWELAEQLSQQHHSSEEEGKMALEGLESGSDILVRRGEGVRFAYSSCGDMLQLFVDGNSFDCPQPMAPLLALLCDHNQIEGGQLRPWLENEDCRALFNQLFSVGHLYLVD